MNEMTFRKGEGAPVYQGVGATPGDFARAATGSLLIASALLVRGRLGLLLGVAGGGLVYSSRRRRRVSQQRIGDIDALATITIGASPDELYERWRDLENIPRVFRHVIAVEDLGENRSSWRVDGGVKRLHWDAEITVDEPGRRLAWRSLPEGDVHQEGEVTFRRAPGDRGTVVTVRLRYSPPAGKLGAVVAGLMGRSPRQTLREDLRRLKMLVETGEIATTDGQPAARANRAGRAGKLGLHTADAAAIVRRPHQSQEAR